MGEIPRIFATEFKAEEDLVTRVEEVGADSFAAFDERTEPASALCGLRRAEGRGCQADKMLEALDAAVRVVVSIGIAGKPLTEDEHPGGMDDGVKLPGVVVGVWIERGNR